MPISTKISGLLLLGDLPAVEIGREDNIDMTIQSVLIQILSETRGGCVYVYSISKSLLEILVTCVISKGSMMQTL